MVVDCDSHVCRFVDGRKLLLRPRAQVAPDLGAYGYFEFFGTGSHVHCFEDSEPLGTLTSLSPFVPRKYGWLMNSVWSSILQACRAGIPQPRPSAGDVCRGGICGLKGRDRWDIAYRYCDPSGLMICRTGNPARWTGLRNAVPLGLKTEECQPVGTEDIQM